MSTTKGTSNPYTFDDKEAFSSTNHPGYSIESDSQDFSGGWLAHRNVQGSCWIKDDVGPKLSVSFVFFLHH